MLKVRLMFPLLRQWPGSVLMCISRKIIYRVIVMRTNFMIGLELEERREFPLAQEERHHGQKDPRYFDCDFLHRKTVDFIALG
jgi:hypothetical protein